MHNLYYPKKTSMEQFVQGTERTTQSLLHAEIAQIARVEVQDPEPKPSIGIEEPYCN